MGSRRKPRSSPSGEPQSWTPAGPADKSHTAGRHLWTVGAFAGTFLFGGIVGMAAAHDSDGQTLASAEAHPTATVTTTATITARPRVARSTPTPSPRRVTVEDGTWTVGVDMPAGTYRAGSVVDETCYWKISKSGSNGETIIANDIPGGGRPVVTVRRGQDFNSSRCGMWVKIR